MNNLRLYPKLYMLIICLEWPFRSMMHTRSLNERVFELHTARLNNEDKLPERTAMIFFLSPGSSEAVLEKEFCNVSNVIIRSQYVFYWERQIVLN